MNLEQATNTKKFRDNKNIIKFRYLPQQPSLDNPNGLPVGWVKSNYKNRDYVGFTCAACHTGQLNYQGTGIRIDGGPTLADMETMLLQLEQALAASLQNSEDGSKFDRLAKTVLGNKSQNPAVLQRFSQRLTNDYEFIKNYNEANYPYYGDDKANRIQYGYARLDAFGRIFNRVLDRISLDDKADSNSPNAPVSYPFLWDTPHHDFVQWTGIADNGSAVGLGPLGRNIGQALGVFASLDIEYKNAEEQTGLKYHTSVDLLNLARLERHVKKLNSPLWSDMDSVLPPIDQQLASEGRKLYVDYGCIACHADNTRTDPNRKIIAQFTSHEKLGTDTTMADNVINRCGDSGFLINKKTLICNNSDEDSKDKIQVASALRNLVTGMILTTKEKGWDFAFTRDIFRKVYVGLFSVVDNPIRNSKRHLDFEIVNKQYIGAYKGRPLNGIWATAPYLHNGSVPTLYDLFLPKCSSTQAASHECRPDIFNVGNPEFDPVKVGFVQTESEVYPGLFEFDTSIPGNGNQGHEYAAGNTPSPIINEQGEIERDQNGEVIFSYREPMSHQQRLMLIEIP